MQRTDALIVKKRWLDRSKMVGTHCARLLDAVMELYAEAIQMCVSVVANQDLRQWHVQSPAPAQQLALPPRLQHKRQPRGVLGIEGRRSAAIETTAEGLRLERDNGYSRRVG